MRLVVRRDMDVTPIVYEEDAMKRTPAATLNIE